MQRKFRPSRSFVDCVVLGGRRECRQRSQKPNAREPLGPTRSKGNSAMSELTPMAVNRTLITATKSEYRQREYLSAGPQAVPAILLGVGMARGRRGPHCALAQVDLHTGRLHVNRAKGGQEALHLSVGPELRALRRLLPARSYVFRDRARLASDNRLLLRMFSAPRPANCVRRAPAHAAACLRIQAHQRWPRHPIAPRRSWGIATCRARRASAPRWRRIGLRGFGRRHVARR